MLNPSNSMTDIYSPKPDGQPNNSKKHLFIKDLKPKDVVRTSFLVKYKAMAASKNGKPYLTLILQDKTGDIDTRVWDRAEELNTLFQEGEVVAVSGKAHEFKNRLQLVVDQLIRLPAEEISLSDYLPEGPANLDERYQELLTHFEGLKNPWVRDVSLALLKDPDIAPRYKLCPAAKTIHHAFLGGLLCHSLQLINLADAILPFYPGIDRDLLLFGAAFHDFGKIFELSYQGNFGYTDEGRLVGHITIGTVLLDRKIQQMPGFPKDVEWQLKHLILSHHGRLDYGSPKRPATLEAQLLHHLDDMDSKINSIQTFMQNERNESRWTAYHKAYDQYYYKPSFYLESVPEPRSE